MNMRKDAPRLALGLLLAISTVGFVDRIVVNVLVEPVKHEFGLSDTQVSFMGVAFTILNIGAALVTARFAERVTRMALISAGTLAWSAATAACGLAASWTQLLAARMGVGLGEAIGLPGLQSVVADFFPAHRRGLAISILMLSPPLGAFIGYVGGGWIAQNFDWRFTFIVAAIPGVILAALAWAFVAEPPRGRHDPGHAASEAVPPASQVLARLFRLSSARNLVIGSSLAAMLGFGLNYFFTSLMIRRFDLQIGEAGLYTGLIASLPAALSVVGNGWLGDRFGKDNPAAYALIPAACLLIGGPVYVLAITRSELPLLLGLISIATFLNFGYLGITFASLQNLMHPRMRATASAMLNVVYGIAAAGGPLFMGMLSDRMARQYGPVDGLVKAMAIFGAFYVLAGLFYLLAARKLRADLISVGALAMSKESVD